MGECFGTFTRILNLLEQQFIGIYFLGERNETLFYGREYFHLDFDTLKKIV